MKTRFASGALGLVLAACAALPSSSVAQQLDANGIGRTEVLRHDDGAGGEAIQVKVDFGPHAAFPRHTHHGVEIAHVLAGAITYELDGKTVILQAGASLYIPAGTPHSARNAGAASASELATYLVDKGKPIVVLAPFSE